MNTTTVSVFGLGYVGCVSAACFAKQGHTVVGVDVSRAKVDMLNAGKSTILEVGIGELVAEMVSAGRLRATTDVADAVRSSEISLICVGTPSRTNGSIDLQYIEWVCTEIGETLRSIDRWHTIVIRSTVLPGTMDGVVIPALERASGKKFGQDFGAVGTGIDHLKSARDVFAEDNVDMLEIDGDAHFLTPAGFTESARSRMMARMTIARPASMPSGMLRLASALFTGFPRLGAPIRVANTTIDSDSMMH